MPSPVSVARQCLASDSATALDAAVTVARRRSHAQTTSLHVVYALLSSSISPPSPSLLREALGRARSSAYSPRLQFKALDLCFSVSLDRLPSSSASNGDDPPISNSLMAAIKRSQANQRRHPDTFHLYQQQQSASGNTSPAFAGVRVELQQLILAILDDPIVSRVFGEAGFRTCDIKLSVLRPPPPILRFPRAARCPPLFLCNFSAAEGFGFQLPPHLAADGGGENCRRIADVILRKSGAARNPILVGVGAAEAAEDFRRVVEGQNWAGLPLDIQGVKIESLDREIISGDKDVICARMEEMRREADDHRVIVSVGDLNCFTDGIEEAANCLVSELTKILESRPGRLWAIGWSATYETYMKFLSRYPMVDKDWNLQLLPITTHRTGMGGLHPKSASLMESFIPFGGLYPQTYESAGTFNNPYQSLPRCQHCNDEYEKEVAVILKGNNATSIEDSRKVLLPSWLQNADVVNNKEGFEISKAKDEKNELNVNIVDLQKKWNEHCQYAHQCSQVLEAKNYQGIPHIVGIPYISDTSSFSKISANLSIPKTQPNFRKAAELTQRGLMPNPCENLSGSESILVGGFQVHHAAPSDLGIQDGHTSPSSVTSVTTELVLGATDNSFSLEGKSCLEGSSQCSILKKINESTISRVCSRASSPPFLCSKDKGSCSHMQSLSSDKTWSSISHNEQRSQNSSKNSEIWGQNSVVFQRLDVTNCKAFYTGLIEKVGRQEEALRTISETIIQCRTRNEKHHGASQRGAIWLSFLGPDCVGKKMTALALAELIFGHKEDLVCIDLSYDDKFCQDNAIDRKGALNCNANFRGKTVIDHIAMEISKRPLSIFLLENVDKTDSIAQSSLSNAILTGKFSDSYGREVSISNSIFVTTASYLPKKIIFPINENICFSEERILAAGRWKMKIIVEPFSESGDFLCSTSSKVSVVPSQEAFVSKRKLEFSGKPNWQDELSTSTKRPHRSSGIDLDLNLLAEELDQGEACNSSSENDSLSDMSQNWLEDFLNLMDRAVSFKAFDFDAMADNVLKEISRGLCNSGGSKLTLEIDVKVIEQILAATWFMRNKSCISCWIEEVLCRSLCELRQRNKLPESAVVRLITNQDLLVEKSELGVFLPSNIIFE